MTGTGWLESEGAATDAVVRLLEHILTEGVVDALLVPLSTPDGRGAVPALIRDAALLERAQPLAPVMPVNAGVVLGRITATGAEGRIAAVLRSCELRTAVELSKVHQAVLDDVVLITPDCLGTYSVEEYAGMMESSEDPLPSVLAAASEGAVQPAEGHSFRPACGMCEHPVASAHPPVGQREPARRTYAPHLSIGLLGVPNAERLWIELRDVDTPLGQALDLRPADPPSARREVVESLVAERLAARDRRFARFREDVRDPLHLLDEFATCIRCQNCMVACPICYCRECIFRTDIFDHPSSRYWDWASRKGALRLPADTLLFHVTRMLHMGHACVGCGMCSDACPVGIPVADIFRAVGQRIQERFGYLPGRSIDEEMVIATFHERELEDLGG